MRPRRNTRISLSSPYELPPNFEEILSFERERRQSYDKEDLHNYSYDWEGNGEGLGGPMQLERVPSTLPEGKQPLCLSFTDIEYSVKVPRKDRWSVKSLINDVRTLSNPFRKETKQILHRMSGHFLPGRLVALMGPSGI